MKFLPTWGYCLQEEYVSIIVICSACPGYSYMNLNKTKMLGKSSITLYNECIEASDRECIATIKGCGKGNFPFLQPNVYPAYTRCSLAEGL